MKTELIPFNYAHIYNKIYSLVYNGFRVEGQSIEVI